MSNDHSSKVMVGAIRWDAWWGGDVTRVVEKTLGPGKYHFRLPWFAKVEGEGKVSIAARGQAVMDREIGYAERAGLNYWAFLLYPEESELSGALGAYLSSAERGRVGFCLILHNAFGVSEEAWPGELRRAVGLLKEPGYVKVLGDRPLVYAFEVKLKGEFPAGRFAEFLAVARAEGMEPYCVWMGWSPAGDWPTAKGLGFEAVSAYAAFGDMPTFGGLAEWTERTYWQAAAKAGVPYVPLVTTGWNKWPRVEHPTPWEVGHSFHQQKAFPAVARPEEIAEHLGRAAEFVRGHGDICAANAVVMYAWNEHDEGGWVVPTWTKEGADESRVEAVRRALRR